MKELLKIGIGTDDFAKLRENNVYYIDKSLFIKDVIDNTSDVCLITRPRRFGKTLNMSMLYYYFNIDMDCKDLFKGLKIMKEGDRYTSKLNNIPTIFISFNGVKPQNIEALYNKFYFEVSMLYEKYAYILDSDKISDNLKNKFNAFRNGTIDKDNLCYSFSFLSNVLYNHYNKRVLILIDEYDVPLREALLNNYYDDAVRFF